MTARSGLSIRRLAAMAVAAFTAAPAPALGCDIALALAIDVSGSVDHREYRLQMDGLAAALRDPEVSDALIAAQAAVLVAHWTGTGRQSVAVDWRRVTDRSALEALAGAVAAAPRPWRNYSTAIGEALLFTESRFAPVAGCRRRVIDVSGDGVSNEGAAPERLKDSIAARGFVINGLAIETGADDLTGYYAANVIAGEGAFVMRADGFEDYPRQIRRKLVREVVPRVASR